MVYKARSRRVTTEISVQLLRQLFFQAQLALHAHKSVRTCTSPILAYFYGPILHSKWMFRFTCGASRAEPGKGNLP